MNHKHILISILLLASLILAACAPAATPAPAQPPAATEAPALAEASGPAIEAPATEPPVGAADMIPQPTLQPQSEDSARIAETPISKEGEVENAANQNLPAPASEAQQPAPFISSIWQTAFALVALIGTVLMTLMRRSSTSRWK